MSDQQLITALRAGRAEHTPEAEPVLVEVDETTATLTLDDGETLRFDVVELRTALTGPGGHRLAA